MIGIVADDITGANDIGTMFAKADYRTYVYSYSSQLRLSSTSRPDVLILDTDSRFDEPQVAYQKVYFATKKLQELGCTRFFKKTCSAARGNIGPELDGMLAALQQDFAVVVFGFPKNGRTTKDGIHYIHGKRLADSEFRNDPVHPMIESDLVVLLQSQTHRKVGLVTHEVVGQGSESISCQLERFRKQYSYVLMDVIDQHSLVNIAQAVKEQVVLGGSSGIAEELAKVFSTASGRGRVAIPSNHHRGVLIAVGSLMPQTRAQVRYLTNRGAVAIELHTPALLNDFQREDMIAATVDRACRELEDGRHVLVCSSDNPAIIDKTRALGKRQGLSNPEISRIVSDSIAEVVKRCVAKTGINRLISAGGDTSNAVCKKLKVEGMQVWEEIEPGIPICYTLSRPRLCLVLKSGSFGQPDFFAKAIARLLDP